MKKPTGPEMVDDALVGLVITGDIAAWRALQTWAAGHVERWARANPRMRKAHLQGADDDVREVLALTLERVSKDNFRNLHKYLAQLSTEGEQARSLVQWLFRVTDYAVREHVRARYGRAPAAANSADPSAEQGVNGVRLSKRDVHTLAGRVEADDRALAHRSEVTSRLTLREIMRHVRSVFTEREAEALRLCFEEGYSHQEIAETLELADAAEADTLLRKLKERLRVRFREQA